MAWSVRGLFGFSSSTRVWILALTPRAEMSSPLDGGKTAGEEELQREDAPGGLHEFVVGDPRHGGFVHLDVFRDLPQRQRPQMLNPFLEETPAVGPR